MLSAMKSAKCYVNISPSSLPPPSLLHLDLATIPSRWSIPGSNLAHTLNRTLLCPIFHENPSKFWVFFLGETFAIGAPFLRNGAPIGLDKQSIMHSKTKDLSFNPIKFHTCCAIFELKYLICVRLSQSACTRVNCSNSFTLHRAIRFNIILLLLIVCLGEEG